jgi:CrcB protein
MNQRALVNEITSLALVAAGAIPGAWLRWGLGEQILLANLLGCLLLGVISVVVAERPRWLLWGAIGFCGSLTTFSSWMLELSRALSGPAPQVGLSVLASHLGGGLALLVLGRVLSRRALQAWRARRSAARSNR